MNLLFLHGAGFTGAIFERQLAEFAGSHAPDLPGRGTAGDTRAIADADSIDDFAAFVEAYVAREHLRDVVLCGHSMGGAVALQVALRGLLVPAGIIALSTGARLRVAPALLQQLDDDFEGGAAGVARLLFAEPTPEQLAWAIDSMRRVGRERTLRDFKACDAFDVLDRLAQIHVPLLALTGECDAMTPPKYGQALADRVPEAKARIVAGAGHMVMLERPEETNAAIRTFLARLRE